MFFKFIAKDNCFSLACSGFKLVGGSIRSGVSLAFVGRFLLLICISSIALRSEPFGVAIRLRRNCEFCSDTYERFEVLPWFALV